jgi:predicted nucleotidyltransferase
MNNTPNMQQDFLKFLQILSEQGAEFIIVGGVAAFLHGGNRVTYDIDLDLLVKESHRFDELRASSKKVEFEGCDYYVASIADLIAMKREAGRPQDLLDIDQLEAIQRRISAD